MEENNYSIELAKKLIGKRVIVSLRHLGVNGEESYEGFWGVIYSAHEDGILLQVEGGLEEKFWMMPPDIDALSPAKHEYYELDGNGVVVENVDFEGYWSTAESIEILDNKEQ